MSTPSTTIHMCSGVPLNNRYDHTLYFATIAEQEQYFMSKVVRAYSEYTYIRRSWKLKVAATMDAARVWSYLFFRNGSTNKTYYYFINQIEYINDNTVELSIELDVLQTYIFDWTLNPCYVEREHTLTDNIGENTIDEGLDVGEYITVDKETINLSNLAVMCAATIDVLKYYMDVSTLGIDNANPTKIAGSTYDGLFGGLQLSATPKDYWFNLMDVVRILNEGGQTDSVMTMWLYPLNLVETNNGSYENAFMKYVSKSKTFIHTAKSRKSTLGGSMIDGYTGYRPKNNKLLQYPYCYMYATNNNGGAAIYQYEKFYYDPTFKITGNLSPDAVVKLTPNNYKGVELNHDEALTLSNFPQCTWNSDSYKMWLAQNQSQQNFGFAMSGLKIAGGAAAIIGGAAATVGTGGVGGAVGFSGISSGVGMVTSGATEIASQLAQRSDKEVIPPQARGTFSGSHNVANGIHNFDIYHKSIDDTHARIIDDYFTMYGYACRQVKTPNINARPAFTFVKTKGSNVTGNFAQDDIKLINDIFDKGVTFWKIKDVGNYGYDNSAEIFG